MGNIPSGSTDAYDENQVHLKIVLDLDQPVKEQLKQLMNWSLTQIRNIYAPFRRRKGSPLLTRSQFLRFIQLSRITSFYIYDNITKQQPINVFQIMSILILTSHTTYSYKLQFLFNVFDLPCNKNLQFYQLILMFKSVVRGFSFLTGQKIPENTLLQKYAHALFSRADLNNDQILQIGQILGWLISTTTNQDCLKIFKNFEPSIFGKEDYHIFNSFVPYTAQQIDIVLSRLSKVYSKKKLLEEDFLMLKPLAKKSEIKQNYSSYLSKNPSSILVSSNRGTKCTEGKVFPSLFKTNNLSQKSKSKEGFLPEVTNSFYKQNQQKSSKYKKSRKFENIIIIKGRTITKKQVYELRQYFDMLSVGKKQITIEDFLQSFSQEKYNHMKSIAASLFNFLDKKQVGKVEFIDLVTKLYPNLSKKHKQTISFWSQEYNKNFNLDKKVKANKNNEESKKRVLPKSCIIRLKELYDFFDTENKGFVNLQNLKQILGNASTEKEIKQIFDKCDTNQDGKLTLKQFTHVLLPPDLQIQGLI